MKQLIDNKASNIDLAEHDFPTFISNYRGLNYYRSLTAIKRDWEMEILVLYGPTGTGKSKWCNDNYPTAYWKQEGMWWDNYANEETVIFDEFYGWYKYASLLKLTDRYPLLVESKHGQLQFNSKRIIFTTNTIPNQWYKNNYFAAFERRVNEWHIFPVWGMHVTFTTFSEAVKHMVENTY